MRLLTVFSDFTKYAEIRQNCVARFSKNIEDIIENYKHPYTEKLIKAFPNIYGDKKMVESIPGAPPNLLDPPKGCRFHPRCHRCIDICKSVLPEYTVFGDEHFVACHVVRGGRMNG